MLLILLINTQPFAHAWKPFAKLEKQRQRATKDFLRSSVAGCNCDWVGVALGWQFIIWPAATGSDISLNWAWHLDVVQGASLVFWFSKALHRGVCVICTTTMQAEKFRRNFSDIQCMVSLGRNVAMNAWEHTLKSISVEWPQKQK